MSKGPHFSHSCPILGVSKLEWPLDGNVEAVISSSHYWAPTVCQTLELTLFCWGKGQSTDKQI